MKSDFKIKIKIATQTLISNQNHIFVWKIKIKIKITIFAKQSLFSQICVYSPLREQGWGGGTVDVDDSFPVLRY